MEHASKMVIVPSELLSKINRENLNELDNEMYDILYSKDLNNEIKWKLYSQCLQRYLHYVGEYDRPVEIPIIEKKDVKHGATSLLEIPPRDKVVTPPIDSNILQIENDLPKNLRKKGLMLYSEIKSKPEFSIEENNNLSYKGSLILDSNIATLVCNAVRSNKKSKPQGWEEFLQYVHSSNIPQNLLGANGKTSKSPKYKPQTRIIKKKKEFSSEWKTFRF